MFGSMGDDKGLHTMMIALYGFELRIPAVVDRGKGHSRPEKFLQLTW